MEIRRQQMERGSSRPALTGLTYRQADQQFYSANRESDKHDALLLTDVSKVKPLIAKTTVEG